MTSRTTMIFKDLMTIMPILRTVALLCSLVLGLSAVSVQARPLDTIVASVNDDIITASELDAEVQQIKHTLLSRGTALPPDADLQRQVLERLIIKRLQLQMAQQAGIEIDDISLNNAIDSIAQHNGVTLEQFEQVLARDGIKFSQFRQQIREEMTLTQVRRRFVDSRIQISKQEVERLLHEHPELGRNEVRYHLGHILISIPEGASAEQIGTAREKAEQIRQRLLSGEDFSTVAASASDGQNALQGGDLGWREGSRLPSLFASFVPAMKPGDLSEVVRSPSGFHIVKLLEKEGGSKVITETHARHILITPNEILSSEQAKAKLEKLRQQILSGADFADLAKANSDDPGSGSRGGDLGWSKPGMFVPAFEKAMESLPVNGISEPFQSPFGWHIVQVLERRNYDASDEQKLMEARKIIHEQKAEQETELWLRRLRDEAFVEYHLADNK